MYYRHRKTAGAGAGLASLLMAGVLVFNAIPAAAVDFAHPAFKRLWDRTDSLVASGQVSRTWFWGPEPRAAAQEQYVDAPNGTGTRLVQYFDKSRMEINDPAADPNAVFFVTNGLLTIELISGQMQIGNNAFVNRYSANIPISGDIDDTNAPTYASFLSVSNTRKGDHPQPDRRGQFATGTIDKSGAVGDDPTKANDNTKIAYFEPGTKHNIPQVFWGFLNATGPISKTGQIVNERLIDPWFYASGLPISDAYWTRVKIAGVIQPVMIQAYERRVLTYVPTNVPGFQVEMGNIGLHYYDWRYRDAGKGTVSPTTTAPAQQATATGTPPTATTTATGTASTATVTRTGTPPTATPTITATPNVVTQGLIAFGSNRANNKYQIFVAKADGTSPKNLSNRPQADEDYPAWSPDGTKIAFVSNRDGNNEIYVMNSDGTNPTRLTSDPTDDINPSWSPDGTRIVFQSKRNGGQWDIFTMNSNGSDVTNITLLAGADTDPSWGASNRIVFSSSRSGTRQVYTMNPDGSGLTGPVTTAGENFLPKWNSVGNRIVFVSTRDGNNEIYTMRQGGEEQTRLTNNTFNEWDPAYAPDSSKIVYSTDRWGETNLELYTMNIDGSNQERITLQEGKDQHPSWKVQR